MTTRILPTLLALTLACVGGCSSSAEDAGEVSEIGKGVSELTVAEKLPRYAMIREAALSRGVRSGYLLAGIANTETGLAHCWSEATWACQGPSSPDCGGGPVIAGSADGPCSIREGGLGMFQFDAGTFDDTLALYGDHVLTVDGQIGAAVDYTVRMVKNSVYTTNAETDALARDWINNFDVHNDVLRDQWVKTVLQYYNGCQPGWSCWAPRYTTYSDGMWSAINDPGGVEYWTTPTGTRCGDSPMTVGAIDVKYRELGGCASVLGAPVSEERGAPDGIGRFSEMQFGSIYWTPATGAHEVHAVIYDKWATLGWETSTLGYPLTDEGPSADGVGRYNHFQNGSIYWSPDTAAHEVHGAIHDAWKGSGWETGPLGYPSSDEYPLADGTTRRSDFQFGYILHDTASGVTSVHLNSDSPADDSDAGASDAGDAGPSDDSDAGPSDDSDAGTIDPPGNTPPDPPVSSEAGGTTARDAGCSMSSSRPTHQRSSDGSGASLALLLALGLIRRRRVAVSP